MTTVRPIIYTDHADACVRLLTALGGVSIVQELGWNVIEMARGRVALQAPTGEARPSSIDVTLEKEDLDDWARSHGHSVNDASGGRAAQLRTGDGVTLSVTLPTSANSAPAGRTSVLPVWMTPDPTAATELLGTAGLEVRTPSEGGGWTVLRGSDGLLAVHAAADGAKGHVELAFEHEGDIEDLIPQLEEAGTNPELVDESFGRTLRVDHPDGGDRLWIHERRSAE